MLKCINCEQIIHDKIHVVVIELKGYMNNLVHNIWAGPIPDNMVEHIMKNIHTFGVNYQFWCFRSEKAKSADLNQSDIEPRIKLLDDIMPVLNENHPVNWPIIINALTELRAYSALKDIFQIAIMWLEGGIYLDTTVNIDTCNHQAFLQKGSCAVPSFVNTRLLFNISGRQVPRFDVWLSYSPPRHPLMLDMLNEIRIHWEMSMQDGSNPTSRYITEETAARSITLPPQLSSLNSQFLRAMQDTTVGGFAINRTQLIGSNILMPLYVSLKRYIQANGQGILSSFFMAVPLSHDQFQIPELGVTKIHRGTWKQQSLDGIAERITGRLVTPPPDVGNGNNNAA